MKRTGRVFALAPLVLVLSTPLFAQASTARSGEIAQPKPTPAARKALPSEMPAKFERKTGSFDHERRVVMIPMRDGVKLKT